MIHAAAAAAKTASVPISVHLDHAQNYDQIKSVADNLPFDSIMVDMSHYEREENLSKTKVLREYCHDRGITVEAETGRIEGEEDGISDTGDLAGMGTGQRRFRVSLVISNLILGILTNAEDVEGFISAGIDFLAPSVGNLHGDYGPKGPHLDMDR